MFETLKQNKIKLVVLIVALLLGWLTFLAFQEYASESASCLSKGGKLIYNAETRTMYCDVPSRKKDWWLW